MIRQLTIALVVLFLASPAASASDEVSPEMRVAVRELIDLTGAADVSRQMTQAVLPQMTGAIRAASPDVPDRAFEILEEVMLELLDETTPELLERMIPIYAAHYTLAEIEEINTYQRSPIGRKSARIQPQLMQESLAASQEWSAEFTPRMVERLQQRLEAEGIDLGGSP